MSQPLNPADSTKNTRIDWYIAECSIEDVKEVDQKSEDRTEVRTEVRSQKSVRISNIEHRASSIHHPTPDPVHPVIPSLHILSILSPLPIQSIPLFRLFNPAIPSRSQPSDGNEHHNGGHGTYRN